MESLIGTEITGERFNELFPNRSFVKLTNVNENHRGLQFNDGLNIDFNEFYPSEECQQGGIYFTELDKTHIWLYYNLDIGIMRFIRKVIIPNDARVYVEHDKFKADKLILELREEISEKNYVNGLKHAKLMLPHLPPNIRDKILHNKELCSELVTFNGCYLKYVPLEVIDTDICLKAISDEGFALRYVPTKLWDKELCLKAVERLGYTLKWIPSEFIDITLCRVAVKQNPLVLRYVPSELKDREMCMSAIESNGALLEYVPDSLKDKEICFLAIKHNECILRFVPNELKTIELCRTAYEYNRNSWAFIPRHIQDIMSINE